MNKDYDMLVSSEVAAGIPLGLRQGHKCCGGCCDMRRAVIIVNIVSCLVTAFLAADFAWIAKEIDNGDISDTSIGNIDDDGMKELGGSNLVRSIEKFLVVVLLCKLPFSAAGIYGAITFKVWPVALSLSLFAIEFMSSLLLQDVFLLVLSVSFAYPHIYFIREVKQGIMSEENYPTEKHSCCCV